MNERAPLLVVDGYNLLHADPTYLRLAKTDIDVARRRLVDDVTVFAARRYEAVIVFDGSGPDLVWPPEVTVTWSGHGEADTIVEALAFEARAQSRPCVVVTSDRATRDAVLGRGVETMRSATMLEHLADSEAEWRESTGRSGGVPLADRLDPGTRTRLERWAKKRPGDRG